jgi:hypothetical protein
MTSAMKAGSVSSAWRLAAARRLRALISSGEMPMRLLVWACLCASVRWAHDLRPAAAGSRRTSRISRHSMEAQWASCAYRACQCDSTDIGEEAAPRGGHRACRRCSAPQDLEARNRHGHEMVKNAASPPPKSARVPTGMHPRPQAGAHPQSCYGTPLVSELYDGKNLIIVLSQA